MKEKVLSSYGTGYIWRGTLGCNFLKLLLTPSQPQLTLTTPGIFWQTNSNLKKNFQKIAILKENFQMCNQERKCFKNERKATS